MPWLAPGAAMHKARDNGVPMSEINLMDEIIRYNEVDCRVMMEIVRYLRMHH